MPRKSAAVMAPAKGAVRATAAPAKAAKPAAKPAKAAAAKAAAAKVPTVKTAPAKATQAKSPKPSIRLAAKAAAQSLAAPALKRSARKPAAAPVPVRNAVRNVVHEAARDATPARPVLVRDSFTMPEQEYAVLAEVKQACLCAGIDVKKSELLRIGVALLGQVDVATLKLVLAALPQLKTGRPPAFP